MLLLIFCNNIIFITKKGKEIKFYSKRFYYICINGLSITTSIYVSIWYKKEKVKLFTIFIILIISGFYFLK